jgi:hypothetical protein
MHTLLFRRLPIRRLAFTSIALVGMSTLAFTIVLAPNAGAQQLPSAQSVVVSAEELGPGWTERVQRTDGRRRWEIRHVEYVRASHKVTFAVAVAPNVDSAEEAIKVYRAFLGELGARILSVQDRGFGDGNAFKVLEIFGDKVFAAYLFRVRNIAALVQYEGPAADSDVVKLAENFARLQEGKLWAAFASPTPTPAPTVAPAPPPAIPAPIPTPAAVAADPYCLPGQKPAFAFGFAALQERLGPVMGSPTSCEYGDPNGSGDTLQNTTAGLAFYRKSTNTPTFTTGFDHWAQTAGGLVYWTGDSIDPAPDAQILEESIVQESTQR